MRNTLNEFKAFLLRGNVVDLAVGFVIGLAFAAVVQALVRDIITPIVGIPGSVDFSSSTFVIHGSVFRYGDFINQVVSFVSISAAVFFFVVKPVNMLMERRKTTVDVTSVTKECPQCLSNIPNQARKCAFCTSEVSVGA